MFRFVWFLCLLNEPSRRIRRFRPGSPKKLTWGTTQKVYTKGSGGSKRLTLRVTSVSSVGRCSGPRGRLRLGGTQECRQTVRRGLLLSGVCLTVPCARRWRPLVLLPLSVLRSGRGRPLDVPEHDRLSGLGDGCKGKKVNVIRLPFRLWIL